MCAISFPSLVHSITRNWGGAMRTQKSLTKYKKTEIGKFLYRPKSGICENILIPQETSEFGVFTLQARCFRNMAVRHISKFLRNDALDFFNRFTLMSGVMNKSQKAALNSAIEKVVRTQFADAAISAVHVTEDSDYDGDPILRVVVVFETSVRPDLMKASGLARHIWPALEENGSHAFPVISFRSKADQARLREAA